MERKLKGVIANIEDLHPMVSAVVCVFSDRGM
jgi:hypothetical protein